MTEETTEKMYYKVTPKLIELAEKSKQSSYIDPELYTKYDVKRGLRDVNGRGVLVGITDIMYKTLSKSQKNQTISASRSVVTCYSLGIYLIQEN